MSETLQITQIQLSSRRLGTSSWRYGYSRTFFSLENQVNGKPWAIPSFCNPTSWRTESIQKSKYSQYSREIQFYLQGYKPKAIKQRLSKIKKLLLPASIVPLYLCQTQEIVSSRPGRCANNKSHIVRTSRTIGRLHSPDPLHLGYLNQTAIPSVAVNHTLLTQMKSETWKIL